MAKRKGRFFLILLSIDELFNRLFCKVTSLRYSARQHFNCCRFLYNDFLIKFILF